MQFNVPALIAGTVLAIVLALLGVYMLALGDLRLGDAPVEDAGLLCLMTLDNSAVASRLSEFSMLGSEARRRAGRFSVEIVGGRLVAVEDIGDPDYYPRGDSRN